MHQTFFEFILVENIRVIDWEGDEYHNYPHLYCKYNIKGKPISAIHYYFMEGREPKEYYIQAEMAEPIKKRWFPFK